ncbi:flagellar biosynthetic protein FliO [Mixta intestinalis]|jgi:flagellar protein FliO/FliZ|uniref:Flagellar protein n=1 Tax=Mixta intestinalis TaxID=1615494 RepID=A0A6P1Q033_9GAMM|nr:flagellar biosynthetic protein FliO [Mixta intestinalis]QHM71487.1 Flagellar protein FliO [Mixta intestinalis]
MNSYSQQPAASHAAPPTFSTGSALTQVSSVLALIVLLILACAWLMKRLGFAPKHVGGPQALNISASVQVGQRERVIIVNVDNARLVLGVTAQQITHLHTLPAQDPTQQEASPAAVTPDFRQLLQTLVKRPGKPQ